MKFFLLRMKVNGIKSIDKELQLDFYKGTLSKKFDVSNSHVKAIYGPNGAGKTALVYAVEIYKNLVMNSDYLAMSNATGALDNLINQKSNRFIIEMYFAVLNKEQQLDSVYSHKIVLEKVRAAVGDDFPVFVRLGGCDYTDGGSTEEDAAEAGKLLEQYGADLIDVSGGMCSYRRPEHTEPGYFCSMSRKIKAEVSVPVLVTGGVVTLEQADEILKAGSADLVGVGRALLKDPHWEMKG